MACAWAALGQCALVTLVIVVSSLQAIGAIRHRNLTERLQTVVASLNSNRGIILPPLDSFDAFPHAMLLTELRSQFVTSSDDRKLALGYALAHIGETNIGFLVERIQDVPAEEVDNLITALASAKDASRRAVVDAFASSGDTAAETKMRLAIIAAYLGDCSLAEEACTVRPVPMDRVMFIETLAKWHGGLSGLLSAAAKSNCPFFHSALCMGIGSIPADQIKSSEMAAWKEQILQWYQHSPSAVLHSASGSALRQWKCELPNAAPSKHPTEDRQWHVNSVGLTMLQMTAGKFLRHDKRSASTRQVVVLTRAFLLADREVSRGLFQQFMDDTDYPASEKPPLWQGAEEEFSPTAEHPIQNVSWSDAVMFCNWLSKREGLDVAYQRATSNGADLAENNQQSVAWEWISSANGYRLPTEGEWEYACRGSSTTAFSFGEDEQSLDRYAVNRASRTQPCGSRLPNGFGLFDMHGNVWEWCQDWSGDYDSMESITDPPGPATGKSRILRGGAFNYLASNLRSLNRNDLPPVSRNNNIGFRVARTFP